MTAPAAITGDYADLKTVKTRSVVQLIIECPIEQGAEIVQMFGFPQPGKPVAVAVARLDLSKVTQLRPPAAKERRKWSDLPLAQQAAIRCGEPAFWKFLTEQGEAEVNDAEKAATYVRLICRVHSRADIDKYPRAVAVWRDLDSKYDAWLRVA